MAASRPLPALLAAIIACPALGAYAERLRARRGVFDSNDGTGSTGAAGDYMDRYIASAHGDTGSAWWASQGGATAPKRLPAELAAGQPAEPAALPDQTAADASRWPSAGSQGTASTGVAPGAQPRGRATGAVVDVKLDSELQTSKSSSFAQAKDVYIRDDFSEASAGDAAEQRSTEDNGDMKA